jgi:hypothetical protein
MRYRSPSAPVSGKETQQVSEQLAFAEDQEIEHPVPLPPSVLRLLLRDNFIKEAFDSADESDRKDPSRILRAGEIHLADLDEVDMVVIGYSPMAGADSAWFWVVRSANRNPQLVLAASGNAISFQDSRTLGFRDVVTVRASASQSSETTYRFDGAEYKQSEFSSSPLTHDDVPSMRPDDGYDDDNDNDDVGEEQGATATRRPSEP